MASGTKRKRRTQPMNFANKLKDEEFWRNCCRESAYATIPQHTVSTRDVSRQDWVNRAYARFSATFSPAPIRGRRPLMKENSIHALEHWIKYNSWRYCARCNSVSVNNLTSSSFHSKGAAHTPASACPCRLSRYVIPTVDKYPPTLHNLTKDDEDILRIFAIDIGPRKYAAHGHRIKTGAFELRYRKDTVEDRVANCGDELQRNRLQEGYRYLCQTPLSTYRDFLLLQSQKPAGTKIKFWATYSLVGIECALWPVLYPFRDWCESVLSGSVSRDSILTSFRTKMYSSIIDYSDDFPLLQFHYDRWLFKTVTGAVQAGKVMKASPLKVLENKHFCIAYWQWQNRFLRDAVLQYGCPAVFITISPYEWDFPLHLWIEHQLKSNGALPTRCGPLESIHIIHVLDQIVRGYLTGCNDQGWETSEYKHIFYNYKHLRGGNVETLFLRYEFQKRGTPHVHVLIWLNDIADVDVKRIKASVPTHDVDEAFLVYRLQKSDRPAPFLKVREEESLANRDGFFLHHTREDAVLNIRVYIDTLLPVLKCRMDVQTSDGNNALLKYVCSYVTKLQEDQQILRCTDSTGFQAAWPFLVGQRPLLPEMAICFTNTRISYCNWSRVKLVPPTEEYLEKSAVFSKYFSRDDAAERFTCLQYCRQYAISKSNPTLRDAAALVGVHYKHIFNPRFFWEYTIVNTPFRTIEDIKDVNYHRLPPNLKSFSYLISNHREFLLDPVRLADFLCILGYNESKVVEFRRLTKGYTTLYYRFLRNTDSQDLPMKGDNVKDEQLNPFQEEIFHHIVRKVETRATFSLPIGTSTLRIVTYDNPSEECPPIGWDSSDGEDHIGDIPDVGINTDLTQPIDVPERENIKFTVITGEPGTGKTFVVRKVIAHAIEKGLQILYCHPTGFGCRQAQIKFGNDNLVCDTFHAIFKISITEDGENGMNWALLKYDIIIIDEIGMVTNDNIIHMCNTINTLPLCPVVILLGDRMQQQPLCTINGITTVGENMFVTNVYREFSDCFQLYKQERITCNQLNSLLRCMRKYTLSKKQMKIINTRVILNADVVNEETIVRAYQDNPSTTFLCLTNNGCLVINRAIVNFLFQDEGALFPSASFLQGKKIERWNVYLGLRLIITENINKHDGLVNGESCVVTGVHDDRDVIFVKLANGTNHFVSSRVHDTLGEYFPFLPDYCKTIFKCQGRTLPHITLWFDNDIVCPGAAYVAFSRVRRLWDICLLQPIKRCNVTPITYQADVVLVDQSH